MISINQVEIRGKSRELLPLNVYLRIRPFIDDEFQRNENQKLINIRDEKHISVKLLPTINNTLRSIQTSYNEYEVTRIFDQNCTQQELFEEILEEPTNEIFTGSNWLFCTFGLTNSGKTHTMFGTENQPGLISQCLHRIFLNASQNIDEKLLYKPVGLENFISTNDTNLNMEMIVRNYIFKDEKSRLRLPTILQEQNQILENLDECYSIWISFFELYNETILDLLVQPKDMKQRKHLRLIQNDHSTMIKNLIQIPVFDIKEAEQIIQFGFTNRSTSKTNLNQFSSRSHAIICITLITINEFDDQPTLSHMYICDLAGNEPSITQGKQLTETCNINTSLMTFKDCIRILSENQTAKKQMLIPYRNSVLTSIFRPFFVGRGRTIICCNINPCATFINQTNDLLKFCALAQKTVVMQNDVKPSELIRQQRKSKNKGPKRLGKQNLSKEKKLNHNKNDTDDYEYHSLNRSSMLIPGNIKSMSYWKFCTKRALDLLQKQASNRRRFLIERHHERIQTIQYLIHQRQLNEVLINENQLLNKQNELLTKDLCLEQEKHFHSQQSRRKLEKDHENKLLDKHNENLFLKNQLKILQEQIDQTKNDSQEEIQRLKRDLGLELYRKQDAEKKARLFEEKFHHEQTSNQKIQYDLTKIKHDFTTLQVKYDALQFEMIDRHEKTNEKSVQDIEMADERTSATTINEEKSSLRTNDKEKKRSKHVTSNQSITNTQRTLRKESTASNHTNVDIPIKQISKKKSANQEDTIDSNLPEPDSPIYATIQRKTSVDRISFTTVAVQSPTVSIPQSNETTAPKTPKSSTFKRIQSFFRVTPTSTNSGQINRVMQLKSTVVAFGSSTPTNRMPPSIVKTPGPILVPTSNATSAQKVLTPKPKYNLRTRLFNNPVLKDENEKKSQMKKPTRVRK